MRHRGETPVSPLSGAPSESRETSSRVPGSLFGPGVNEQRTDLCQKRLDVVIGTKMNHRMKDTTQSRIACWLGLLPEVSTSNEAALSLSTWAPPAVASRAVRNR
jgi:hypothetical protein